MGWVQGNYINPSLAPHRACTPVENLIKMARIRWENNHEYYHYYCYDKFSSCV